MTQQLLNVEIDSIIEYLDGIDSALVSALLKDHTTGKSIRWCTNAYSWLGARYSEEAHITRVQITGDYSKVIQPRIVKSIQTQEQRTREKGEVFTPSWVCNQQNNLIDEAWFGKKNVFNTESNQSWNPSKGKITFPNVKGKKWKDYITANRLEVACGEAPYLTSRYICLSVLFGGRKAGLIFSSCYVIIPQE